VVISEIVALVARKFALMAGLIISAIMLFICFELLRNNTYKLSAVQGVWFIDSFPVD
jgi:hypothetical protein